MKTSFAVLLLVLTLACVPALFAQTTASLSEVQFADANTVFASGAGGTVLRSNDGGMSWQPLSSGVSHLLVGMSFSSASVGTIVGGDGLYGGNTIIRTGNSGATWDRQTSGTNWILAGVSFPTPSIGYAVGDRGTILKTTNSGADWVQIASGVEEYLYGVAFTDANTGTVVGGWGRILRTTNGGATWSNQSSGTTSSLYDISFSSPQVATIVGNAGKILRTTNGGATWTAQSSGTSIALRGVHMVNANVGFAVGWYGLILRTTNGGSAWLSQQHPSYNDLYGVSFRDASTGIIVGGGGLILRTTDGGLTWAPPSGGGGGNPPAAPTLASPSNGATNQPSPVTLSWNASTGATSYRLQVSTSSGFGSTVYDNASISGTSQSVGGLASGTTYYWRVNASNSNGTSSYSSVWSFTTASGGSPPATPTLASPANGATNQSTSPTLTWNASSGAESYRLQVSTSSAFSSTVYDNASLTSTSQTVSGLSDNTTYYWRVNAANGFGTSAWSSVWSFTTELPGGGGPVFTVSPASLNFGTVPVGSSATLPVTVTNTGLSTLVISNITSSSPKYSVSPTSASVPAGGSQVVNITFTPSNKNTVSAQISFTHNAPDSPGLVSVTGRGGARQRTQGNASKGFVGGIPDGVELAQNYPNPFNPSTVIEYGVPEDSRVKLGVYNLLGQEVGLLVDEIATTGYYYATWTAIGPQGEVLPSGIYLYRLQTTSLTSGEVQVVLGKMQLVK